MGMANHHLIARPKVKTKQLIKAVLELAAVENRHHLIHINRDPISWVALEVVVIQMQMMENVPVG